MNAIADRVERAGKESVQRKPDFRRLLGDAAWSRLPAAVRSRFSAEAHAATTVYRGIAKVEASFSGRLLAHVCRLIGTPVAPHVGDDVPMTVRVFESDTGVVWERRYEFASRDVIVRSTKQLDDDGMLVECLNAGLHMRLRVLEEGGELHFVSTGYFFKAGALRFNLPQWFLPGTTHVVHEDRGGGYFRFGMVTDHRLFGRMFCQDGIFR